MSGVKGHAVVWVNIDGGEYRCKCGARLARTRGRARDLQRFHLLDVRLAARGVGERDADRERP